MTSLGTVAILSVFTVIIILLSSGHAHVKQECCSGSRDCSQPDSTSTDDPDGISIVNQAVSSHLLRKRLDNFSGSTSFISENVSLLSQVLLF